MAETTTDTTDLELAERFTKHVFANGEMDVFGLLVHAKTIGSSVWVEVMPTTRVASDSARMSRAHAIELRDALDVLLRATATSGEVAG